MLTHVPVVDQEQFKDMARFTIRHGGNLLIIGPSGGGKTEIINSVCEEEDVNVQYINLAVLERTDFQGFPVISENKKQVQYATPRYIPFIDSKLLEEKGILQNALDLLSDDYSALKAISARISEIEMQEKAISVSENMNIIRNTNPSVANKLNKLVNSLIENNVDNKPFVFLFDEADKAPAETSNVLLEILQFHSVNGRKINLRACFLTGNLPDEYANSGSISHAISKRCRTVQLSVNWKIWREWAFSSKVHPNIISFITSHPEWLYKKAPDGDPTAYALPSPRTWTLASDALTALEKDNKSGKYSDLSMLVDKLVAANVGEGAASEFKVWLEHYQELDPIVDDIFEKAKYPKQGVLSAQQVLIAAISACNKVYAELKNDKSSKDSVVRHIKNVYRWLATLPVDVQHGSVRLSFGGDHDIVTKWDLAEIDEFYEIFDQLKKTLSSWKSTGNN